MNSRPTKLESVSIMCFQHCRKDVNIFYMDNMPHDCPVCGSDLSTAELRIPPFCIPSPFLAAHTTPCSVVVQPTGGHFLEHYQILDDLHIGVTNSQGVVYEYSELGPRTVAGSSWQQCICVYTDLAGMEKWDQWLDHQCHQPEWTTQRYDETAHNCYSFVLSFLRSIYQTQSEPSTHPSNTAVSSSRDRAGRLQSSSECVNLETVLSDKTTFCEQFILPKSLLATKYIALFKRLNDERVMCQQTNS